MNNLATKSNPTYEKTTVTVYLNDLKLHKENPTHYIYYCPECENKRGKPDLDGRLYFNKFKNVGWCFKCNTAFKESKKDEESSQDDDISVKIIQEIDRLVKNMEPEVRKEYEAIEFNFDELNDSLNNFLKVRNMFLPKLIEYLNLKAYYGDREGIVTPFYIDGKICMYQIRFNTTDHKYRHYTSQGEKVLYSPNRIFDDRNQKRTITLCEGTFDAIALLIMGYENPVAVLGSSITENQIKLLRSISPERVHIAMDKVEISYNIKKQTLKRLPTVSDVVIEDFGGSLDPEEFLMAKSKKDLTWFKKMADNIKGILNREPPRIFDPVEYYLKSIGVMY